MSLKAADLIAGQRYRVTFDDCCVQGWFEGVFVELVHDDEEGELFAVSMRFDCGEIGPVGWGSYTIEETP